MAFHYNRGDGSTQMFIYSGLDGTGDLLGSGTVPPEGGPPGDWPVWGLFFSGTAHSVLIIGNPGIEFSSLTGGGPTPIPEPTSLILLATGLAGWRRWRNSTQK